MNVIANSSDWKCARVCQNYFVLRTSRFHVAICTEHIWKKFHKVIDNFPGVKCVFVRSNFLNIFVFSFRNSWQADNEGGCILCWTWLGGTRSQSNHLFIKYFISERSEIRSHSSTTSHPCMALYQYSWPWHSCDCFWCSCCECISCWGGNEWTYSWGSNNFFKDSCARLESVDNEGGKAVKKAANDKD